MRGPSPPAERAPLDVVLLVDEVLVRHEVVHHDEADVAPHARLDSDEAEEAGYERVLAALHHVLVVVGQDLPQELGLLLRDRLDDELAILRQVKHRAALAGRAELSQRVLAADGDHVLLRVHAEVLAQVAEVVDVVHEGV